ncbi:MAG: acetylornithine carbamoyltransferase [Candidatus Fischerbacteria bacterium RBG_13_37_8]|uniref:Acetylornithine carbamoyltransferase n=1 Tax=Candidatus Fischerbacteria bacterium RBG_13_37_8 TaxID=1817863 RepID=A0A1F5VTW0_9BACT|nr:MAG: acetylornithine carbamoyltransferase [Candidatus Fischerbacteria bacterium RBG_13_37_8]
MNLKNKNFINTQDWTLDELDYILDLASAFKNNSLSKSLAGKSIALLFFNPSLRTRTSFEIAMHRLGGFASIIQPGKDAWPIETREGIVMDQEAEEHIKEAVRVISSFYDAIAVRAFPKFQNWQEDKQDSVLTAITRWALKPVINMETIIHPLQELALMMTIKSHFSDPRGKKFLLTWTYHPKGLNTAVANSAALISTRFGMDVTILRPQGYDLDPQFIETAKANAASYGNAVTITDNIEQAYHCADFVYAKSWGSLNYFGNWEEEKNIRRGLKHFIVDSDKMKLTNNAFFSHCLPMRRNVKATDEVIDSEYSLIYEEAENRLYTTCALLTAIFGGAL